MSDRTMTCKKCRALQIVAMLEPERLMSTARAAMAEHQAQCPACRNSAAQLQLVQDALQPSPTPEKIIQETHANIMAAVKRDSQRHRVHYLTRIAAILLIGVGLVGLSTAGLRALQRTPVEQARPIVRNRQPMPVDEAAPTHVPRAAVSTVEREPEISPLEEAFLAAENHMDAWKILRDAYEAEKARTDGHTDDYHAIIRLCAQLKDKWPISNEAANSLRLASMCWTELGEAKKSQDMYIAFADYSGELEERQELKRGKTPEEAKATATDIASRYILSKAGTLFSHQDYVQSLSYCDVMMTRYPTHERGLEALCMVGFYSERHKQYGEAIRVYEQVINLNPDSRAADLARTKLPGMLSNSGRNVEAAEVWLECAQRAKTRRQQANYTYLAARKLLRAGNEHEAEAIALLEKVIADYPDIEHWVERAKRSLNRIRLRPLREPLKGVENPLEVVS